MFYLENILAIQPSYLYTCTLASRISPNDYACIFTVATKDEETIPNESDNNNTTNESKEEVKESKAIPAEVFQTIVNMFPEKSWTEADIKTR